MTAFRAAFRHLEARVGRQPDRLAGSMMWVLPHPSGLNAHYQLDELAGLFRQLREEVFGAASGRPLDSDHVTREIYH